MSEFFQNWFFYLSDEGQSGTLYANLVALGTGTVAASICAGIMWAIGRKPRP